MLASHIKDDEIEIKKCYVAIGILDKKDLHCKKNTELFEFLRNFGRLIVRPYSFSEFDFGDEEYRTEFNSFARKSMEWRDIRVSRHFIFISKLLFGLYGMLMQLKPIITTEQSKKILLGSSRLSRN